MAAPPDSPEVLERFHTALDLVDALVRHLRRSIGGNIASDELTSYGREGLLEAARRYEPERGIAFRTYASYRVRGAIIDGVRAGSRVSRRTFERLQALEAAARVSEGRVEDVTAGPPPGARPEDARRALGEHLAGMATAMAMGLVVARDESQATPERPSGDDDDPEVAVARAQLVSLVERELTALPEDEQTILRRHYFEGADFEVVARDLGLSRSWASRLHARAIGRLSHRLRGSA